jgi:CxxC motif-containing protein (DUF1111 family)
LVRVGSDAKGKSHPKLGATLQMQAASGESEASVVISSWTTTKGTFGDGAPFELRKPIYKFTGMAPEYYSVRIAPPLVGMGLLEAVDEKAIAPAESKHGRARTVADPENHQTRLGRFGWKSSQARLVHQIASALNNDMGVATAIYPNLDRGTEQPERGQAAKLPAADLDNIYRYVALLGVPPRRDHEEAEVVKGQALFTSAGCAKCHTPMLRTSAYHPFAELRNQTIRPYTDLLLHDMGAGLADKMGEENASGAEWRTPPLWGIGLTAGVSGGEAYLHDGRARSLAEAILWHGGDGHAAREAFRTMAPPDRAALIRFLQSL